MLRISLRSSSSHELRYVNRVRVHDLKLKKNIMGLETLHEATRRYRLRDSGMTNVDIARRLGAENCDGDFKGTPSCCFFSDGHLAAIRTKPDEVAIFHLFQRYQVGMPTLEARHFQAKTSARSADVFLARCNAPTGN